MSLSRLVHAGPSTTIHADAPGNGNASHTYEIRSRTGVLLTVIHFQNGPIGESGVNGVQHEDLLRIVQDRLDGFQAGPYASAVNEVSCGFVSAAIASDTTRTRRRVAAGTEGTSSK